MKYVDARITFPPSGPAIRLEPTAFEEVTRYYDWEGLSARYVSISNHEQPEVYRAVFNVGPVGTYTRGFHQNGRDFKASWRMDEEVYAFGKALQERGLGNFGHVAAKLWLTRDPTQPSRGLVMLDWSMENAPPPTPRIRHVHKKLFKDPQSSPPQVAPALVLATSRIVVPVAGRELVFNLPMEEAFALSLDWTERGYRVKEG